MAEGHYCVEHQTVWFKRGKMKGFAHPIKDENGEDTGSWCNEPVEKEPKPDGIIIPVYQEESVILIIKAHNKIVDKLKNEIEEWRLRNLRIRRLKNNYSNTQRENKKEVYELRQQLRDKTKEIEELKSKIKEER